MLGFGQDYLQTFALAMNKGERITASLLAVPQLMGAVFQLMTPVIVRRLGSHKRWVLVSCVVQGLAFVPLAIGAIAGTMPSWLVLGAIAMYWFGGLSAGAAWSTWMPTIVPRAERAGYFSKRTRYLWFVALVTTLTSGWILATAKDQKHELLGFAVILGAACLARLACAWTTSFISEPEPIHPEHRRVRLTETLHKLLHGHDGRLMGYLMLVNLSINVTQPFVAVWVLGPLGNAKETWAFCAAALTVGRIVALYTLGNIIRTYGPKRVLMGAGIALIPLHGLFCVSGRIEWIVAVQVIAGVVLAAFDMSQWLMLVDHTADHERTSMFSIAYFFNIGLMPTLGWLIGSAMLTYGVGMGGFQIMGTNPPEFSASGYAVLFAVGTAFRAVTLVPLLAWVRRLPE